MRFLQYNFHWKSPLMENICHKRRTVQEWESTVAHSGILYSWIVEKRVSFNDPAL